MKKYSITLLIMCTTFFATWSMEDIIPKTICTFIRKAMNKDFTQKTITYKHQVRERIEILKSANIIEYKDYQYTQESKLNIMDQFFTRYPDRIYPELKLILKNINNSFNRQDFITLLPRLKTQTQNYALKDYLIASLIELTQTKKINFNEHEIKLMNDSLTTIHFNLTQNYNEMNEKITKIVNLENEKTKVKATATRIRTQKEKNIYDLEQYRDELEELIAHLEKQQTPQNILDQYQETVTLVVQRIDFLTEKRKSTM
jgi:hypothetical protein